MLREIKNCPLVAVTRDGNIITLNHNATIKGNAEVELTVECIAQIAAELFLKGIDIISVGIDENRKFGTGSEGEQL